MQPETLSQAFSGSSLNHKALWKYCVQVYDSFNSTKHTPDTHCSTFLKENQIEDKDDQLFIYQVMYGLDRYRQFLLFVTKAYLDYNKEALVSDTTNYLIVTYLSLFRWEELTFKNLKALLKSAISPTKLVAFLKFLYNMDNVNQNLLPQWLTLYDEQWIRQKILDDMERHLDTIQRWIEAVDRNVKCIFESKERPTTKIEPFNMSESSRSRKSAFAEEAVEIPVFKPKEVPNTTYECDPVTKNFLEKYKATKKNIPLLDPEIQKVNERRKQELIASTQAESLPFQTIQHRRVLAEQKLEHRLLRAQREQEEKLSKQKPKPKDFSKVKETMDKPAEIKLNAAAILREDSLYRRKQEKEASILQRYETELRDASNFFEWKQEMEAIEEQQRVERIVQRKKEILEIDERAREAKKIKQKENVERVQKLKEKAEEELQAFQELKKKEQEELAKKAQQLTKVTAEKVQHAKKEVSIEKIKKAEKVREERVQNETLVAERLEIGRQLKEELIMQIRAMEAVPSVHVKVFDPTETGNLGLLVEMSHSELKARLDYLQHQKEKEREAKNQEIINQKKEKELDLLERAQKLSSFRTMAKAEREKRRELKLMQDIEQKKSMKEAEDNRALEIQEKLVKQREKKRQEMRRIAKESSERRKQQQFLGADRSRYEENKFKQQELAAERSVKARHAIK